MTQTRLTGLDGSNPLGYLAALGCLLVADRMIGSVRLSWTSGLEAVATLHGAALDELVHAVMDDRDLWKESPALGHLQGGVVDDVKFAGEIYVQDIPHSACSTQNVDDVKVAGEIHVRNYLKACAAARDAGRSLALAQALVCEFAVDNEGNAKPTDLHFTAGQQRFLRMARELRDGLQPDDIRLALTGPWKKRSTLPSFKWDVADDRVYALTGRNPAGEKKLTEPGAEWLALQGLAAYGVQRSATNRVAVPGASGSWKRGKWTWPLWTPALSVAAAFALVNRGDVVGPNRAPDAQLGLLGVSRILSATVLRTEQGGYGSFRPSVVLWERS